MRAARRSTPNISPLPGCSPDATSLLVGLPSFGGDTSRPAISSPSICARTMRVRNRDLAPSPARLKRKPQRTNQRTSASASPTATRLSQNGACCESVAGSHGAPHSAQNLYPGRIDLQRGHHFIRSAFYHQPARRPALLGFRDGPRPACSLRAVVPHVLGHPKADNCAARQSDEAAVRSRAAAAEKRAAPSEACAVACEAAHRIARRLAISSPSEPGQHKVKVRRERES